MTLLPGSKGKATQHSLSRKPDTAEMAYIRASCPLSICSREKGYYPDVACDHNRMNTESQQFAHWHPRTHSHVRGNVPSVRYLETLLGVQCKSNLPKSHIKHFHLGVWHTMYFHSSTGSLQLLFVFFIEIDQLQEGLQFVKAGRNLLFFNPHDEIPIVCRHASEGP